MVEEAGVALELNQHKLITDHIRFNLNVIFLKKIENPRNLQF